MSDKKHESSYAPANTQLKIYSYHCAPQWLDYLRSAEASFGETWYSPVQDLTTQQLNFVFIENLE